MRLRFSEVQEKEMIDAESGQFIGFIVDAEVDEKSGQILYFYVARPKKFYTLKKEAQTLKKIAIRDIVIIGQDVILVKL